MPDETDIQEPVGQPPVAGDMTAPDFDWDAFWGNPTPTDEPAVPAAAGSYDDLADDLEDDAAKEIVALRKQTEMNARQLEEMRTQATIDRALEAWKKQATPAELALGDLLFASQSLDELKRNEALVKNAAKKAETIYSEQLKAKEADLERQLQEKFGLPVPPSFQPIPQADKANQALAEGDLDRAAAIMLEGMF